MNRPAEEKRDARQDHSVAPTHRVASEGKCRGVKVNCKRLSALQAWILGKAVEGIERGEIAEGYYGLERRYCGYHNEVCLSRRKEREYQRRYRRAQSAITRALSRLEECGLVTLIRHRRNVKRVVATEGGRRLALVLDASTAPSAGSSTVSGGGDTAAGRQDRRR